MGTGAGAGARDGAVPTGGLWRRIVERTRDAHAVGALSPIDTEQDALDDGGVRFVVRRVSTLARKAAQRPHQPPGKGSGAASFPIEPALYVADISDTHLALLNKFPVIPHHLLLVTRRDVPQEALLDRADFAALAAVLSEYDALGFYNGGTEAGASQHHKHLQAVPLPLASHRAVPMEALLDRAPAGPGPGRVPGLPFRHAFCRCDPLAAGAADTLTAQYEGLLAAAGIGSILRDGVRDQCAPYNLLVTRRWMLLVARSREHCDGISINALGYAGSIFVKSDDELARVRVAGPMRMLTAVAV